MGGTHQIAVPFLIYSHYIPNCCLPEEMFRVTARSHPNVFKIIYDDGLFRLKVVLITSHPNSPILNIHTSQALGICTGWSRCTNFLLFSFLFCLLPL